MTGSSYHNCITLLAFVLSTLFLKYVDAQEELPFPYPIVRLTNVDDFKQLVDGNYQIDGETIILDALIDVRTAIEFSQGHIENAMLVDSLANFGSLAQVSTPADLAGCEFCNIAVYCRTVARASTAIDVLRNAGFRGRIFNGRGTSQWTAAGYPLVTTPSVPAPCSVDSAAGNTCQARWEADQTLELSPPTRSPTTEAPTVPKNNSCVGLNRMCFSDELCCGSSVCAANICSRPRVNTKGADKDDARLSNTGRIRGGSRVLKGA